MQKEIEQSLNLKPPQVFSISELPHHFFITSQKMASGISTNLITLGINQ
jgi:hypothetical protein